MSSEKAKSVLRYSILSMMMGLSVPIESMAFSQTIGRDSNAISGVNPTLQHFNRNRGQVIKHRRSENYQLHSDDVRVALDNGEDVTPLSGTITDTIVVRDIQGSGGPQQKGLIPEVTVVSERRANIEQDRDHHTVSISRPNHENIHLQKTFEGNMGEDALSYSVSEGSEAPTINNPVWLSTTGDSDVTITSTDTLQYGGNQEVGYSHTAAGTITTPTEVITGSSSELIGATISSSATTTADAAISNAASVTHNEEGTNTVISSGTIRDNNDYLSPVTHVMGHYGKAGKQDADVDIGQYDAADGSDDLDIMTATVDSENRASDDNLLPEGMVELRSGDSVEPTLVISSGNVDDGFQDEVQITANTVTNNDGDKEIDSFTINADSDIQSFGQVTRARTATPLEGSMTTGRRIHGSFEHSEHENGIETRIERTFDSNE